MKKYLYPNKIILFYCTILFWTALLSSQTLLWRQLPNSPVSIGGGGRFDDVFFINANTGWIIDPSFRLGTHPGRVLKTINGGLNWIVQIDTGHAYYRCIGFADSLNGWIGTIGDADSAAIDTTLFYRTIDGGTSWAKITNITGPWPKGICGLCVVNTSIIYACGRYSSPAHFLKSTDGGATWISKDMSAYASRLIDCYFYSPTSGFVTGGIGSTYSNSKGIVLFTSDGGENWVNRFTTSDTSQWGWKISFPSVNTGYVSLEKEHPPGPCYFLKTTDGGVTWEQKQFMNNYYDEEGVGFVNDNTGWIRGWSGPTFVTTNGGISWQLANFGNYINRFRFLNDTLAYAVGYNVYMYSRYPIGIEPISTTIPVKYLLFQNYPNPFNPSTNIKFNLPNSSFTKLIVYDALGKELVTLVNEQLNAGTYEANWNASNFSSGLYFYKLTVENYTDTRKMLLVK